MTGSTWRAIALCCASGIALTPPLARAEAAGRQTRDTLRHVLDSISGGSFRVYSGLPRARLVVRDSVTWDSLWVRITGNRVFDIDGDSVRPVRFPLPPVDFSREMLIVVSRGPMPSLQYGTSIERVRVTTRELLVDVCSWDPGPDIAQAWAVPTPLDIVRGARSALPVRFVDHSTVDDPFNRPPAGFPECLRRARRRR